MNIRNITFIFALSLSTGWSMAAIQTNFYALTDNSHYSYSYTDFDTGVLITNKTTLTGFLVVGIDDSQVNINDSYSITINYSFVSLNGNPLRSTDTLITDSAGLDSGQIVSGWTGEFDYISYGNATLSPFPFLCVECGYEMKLNLAENPLVLSYYETNNYGTGEVDFELFVSQVPIPAAVWLFGSGLIGLIGLARRKANA